jgi:hypothetical protein
MLPQPIIDALIVIGMVVVRIGLPVAILFALGYWLRKKMEPKDAEKPEQSEERANIIPFRKVQQPSAPRSAESQPEQSQQVKK